jgi:3-hydroxybutyryl-CoA dehydrogenase
MELSRVAVVGAGFMGSGIAQIAAQAGYDVTLVDSQPGQLEKALGTIGWSLNKLHEKGKLLDDPAHIGKRIQTAGALSAVADADIVIEAIYENIDVKLALWQQVDAVVRKEAIRASNTSTIPITKLSEATEHPARMIGIHFFGPVPLMKLVEIIPTEQTDADVVDTVMDFTRKLGKSPVLVRKDIPGFIMNRIFGAMACEAVRLLEEGIGSVSDIDEGMQNGFGMIMGPLAISDLAGLDISYNAFKVMAQLDPKMPAPPKLLEQLVAQGHLGAKTGRGFYYWENGKRVRPAVEA